MIHTKSFIASTLIFAASTLSALSEPQASTETMWDESCTLDSQYTSAIVSHYQNQAPRTEMMKKALEQIQAMMGARDWEKDIPMDEQMTTQEAIEFERVGAVIQNGQLSELIEQKRERDLLAINAMSGIAHAISQNEFNFETLDERTQIYAALLLTMRELLTPESVVNENHPNEKPCTLETAFIAQGFRMFSEAEDVYGLSEAIQDLETFSRMYGSPLNWAAIPPSDMDKIKNDIMPVIQKAQNRAKLGEDYMNLAILERMSVQFQTAMRLDQYEAPGNLEYTGTNWGKMENSGKFSDNEINAAKVLSQLNERVPAQIVSDWENMTDSNPNSVQ